MLATIAIVKNTPMAATCKRGGRNRRTGRCVAPVISSVWWRCGAADPIQHRVFTPASLCPSRLRNISPARSRGHFRQSPRSC